MERWLYARQAIMGNPKRLQDALVTGIPGLLQAATDTPAAPPAGDGSVDIRLHARVSGLSVEKQVRVDIGEVRRLDSSLTIPISWEADPVRQLFPAFSGSVDMATLSAGRVELTLAGSYEPPIGPIGGLGDIILFHDLAERAVQRLTRRLADALRDLVHGVAPPTPSREGTMTVGEVMTGEPLMFGEDQPLRAAAALMLRARISGAPVIGQTGRVVGVLSDRDLLDKAAAPPEKLRREPDGGPRRRRALTVGEACSRPAQTTSVHSSVRDAVREMVVRGVGRLVVLDAAQVVGIITRGDALKAVARQDEDTEEDIVLALAELDRPGLSVEVANGIANISGELDHRSEVPTIIGRIREVSGVLDVRSAGLTWEVDDGVPTIMPLM